MTSIQKLSDSLRNLNQAIKKLQEAIKIPKTAPLVVEGTIQRFEVVVELLWKTLRRALLVEGVTLNPDTPREVMIRGFQVGWLHDTVIWQSLLDKRNNTSHEYLDDSFIEANYQEIINLTPEIQKALDVLNSRFSQAKHQ